MTKPIRNQTSYLQYVASLRITKLQNYDLLYHLTTFRVILVQKRWPSDKINHACENIV